MSKNTPKCHPDRQYYAFGKCYRCYRKDYNKSHTDRSVREKYGISGVDVTRLLEKQDRCCALCSAAGVNLVVDHEHKTGNIRGLLCKRCNIALGGYEQLVDNPRLAEYLTRQIKVEDPRLKRKNSTLPSRIKQFLQE